MDNLELLLQGFATAATPVNLLLALIGVIVGTAVGVLPGIGPAMTVALLLPILGGLEPTSALIMLAGIFYGGMYGGSTTSILLNTPGESSSVVTAIEGNQMARGGRAAQALATAALGSFIAGTIGTALLVFFAPLVTQFAISLGAPEYFAIMLLAFIAVTAVFGASRLRGFISLMLGLTIGLVGLDSVSGQARLTFGIPQLSDGIDVVVVAVGIFALGCTSAASGSGGDSGRAAVAGPGGLQAVMETLAARYCVRFPLRRCARRWGGNPDLSVLHHREAPDQASGGVRQRRHRRSRRP
jgi:putative tricarboxylic transport membrane protein